MKLFIFLEEGNSLLCHLIYLLLICFTTCSYRIPEFLESPDDIFSDLKFQIWNVFIFDVFDCIFYKISIHTFGKHRARFENESHLLFSQCLGGWVILIEKKLSRQVNFVVFVEHSWDFFAGQSLELFLRDKLESSAELEEFTVVGTFLSQFVDVLYEHFLIVICPGVVYFGFFELLHKQRLINEINLLVFDVDTRNLSIERCISFNRGRRNEAWLTLSICGMCNYRIVG